MTRTLVWTNYNGGVGKSTSAPNITSRLVQFLCSAGVPNPRVLPVDSDSQGHATLVTTGSKNYGDHDCLYTGLTTDREGVPRVLTECIRHSNWDDNLHVLSAYHMLERA